MQVYKVDEVARMFKVSRITVLRWIKNGRLRARKLGKGYRITEQDLDLFLNADTNGFVKGGSRD